MRQSYPILTSIVVCIMVFATSQPRLANVFSDDSPKVGQILSSHHAKSGDVSLGDGDFRLFVDKSFGIWLLHNPSGRIRSLKLELTGEKTIPLWTSRQLESPVVEAALCRWSKDSLFAVVKLENKSDAAFFALEMKHIHGKNLLDKVVDARLSFLFNDLPGSTVLAISGNIRSPAIAVVCGRLSLDEQRVIDSGVIAFDWCGEVSTMRSSPIVTDSQR